VVLCRCHGRVESRGAAHRFVRGRHFTAPTSWAFAPSTRNPDPLFIAETRGDMEAKAIYAFGRHDAIGSRLWGSKGRPLPSLT